MTNIYKILFYNPLIKLVFLSLTGIICYSTFSFSEESTLLVTDVEISGTTRTDQNWIFEYLDLHLPMKLTEEEIGKLREKLLTTAIFTRVDIAVEKKDEKIRSFVLKISLEEKWTIIPVVRGLYGGGTPLRVFGVYDTHSFGRLWTLGAETRKYGTAPNGFIVYAKAPRWLEGKHLVGVEVWREFRRRDFYAKDKHIGFIDTDTTLVSSYFLLPLDSIKQFFQNKNNLQVGLILNSRREGPATFTPLSSTDKVSLKGISLFEKDTGESSLLGNIVYDNVFVDNIEMDGTRVLIKNGPLFYDNDIYNKTEVESFLFYLTQYHFNLAFHIFLGSSSLNTIPNQYFLGGFDSIRGYPDGIIHGTRSAYVNLEIRKMMIKLKYLWFQTASFLDYGGAGTSWDESFASRKSSAGLGLRIVIPQVYRLMFRIDYAWSINNPGVSGLNAGLNEFFQPYRPL